MTRVVPAFALAFWFVALMSVQAFGQEEILYINGTVLDMDNHPVPGTSVSLIATDTDTTVSTVLSDKDGRFVFSKVSPQPYALKLEKTGFVSRIEPLPTVASTFRFAGPLTLQMVPLKDTQTPGATDSNIGCIERLQLPEYPALAKQARIQGTITATISVPSPGTSPKVETAYTGPFERTKGIISQPVEDAVRRARFRQGCTGKQVTLILHFELIDDPRTRPIQSVSFGGGNEFWISSVIPSFQP
jgi:hypothetical protein